MIITKSPNLAPSGTPSLTSLQYPALLSLKMDGVRALVTKGKAYSRTGKVIHDAFHKRYKEFLDRTLDLEIVLDGEIWSEEASFQSIISSIANTDGCPLRYHVFDCLSIAEWEGDKVSKFAKRYDDYKLVINRIDPKHEFFVPVEQRLCHKPEEVQEYLEQMLALGQEGLMYKLQTQFYKNGRSTAKQGDFYKIKPFETIDAIIVGFEPKRRLTDEAKATNTERDELGRTKRGSRKDDRVEVDEIGAVTIEYNDNGTTKRCNATWAKNSETREMMNWQNKEQFMGKWVEVSYLNVGVKELLRHPRIVRMREDRDN